MEGHSGSCSNRNYQEYVSFCSDGILRMMNPQNQQLQSNTSEQPPQTENPNEAVAKKSQLSLVGLIFAIIVPPIGLVVSIIALLKIRKNNLQGKGKAIFGIIWGAIFTLPFIFLAWLFISLGGLKGNEAKKDAQPFVAQIQKAGGKELCENGDSGYGIDNTQPWYEVYYEIPSDSQLTAEVKADAVQFGYPLAENTGLINKLKGIPDKNGDINEPYGGATFNSKSDYLISSKNGKSLTVTINRETSVPLYCGVSGYGNKKSTGNNDAILDIDFTLPDRNQ